MELLEGLDGAVETAFDGGFVSAYVGENDATGQGTEGIAAFQGLLFGG